MARMVARVTSCVGGMVRPVLLLLLLGHPLTGSKSGISGVRRDPAPSIHSQTKVVKLEVGNTARFPCSVTNLGPLVLIWKHGTRVLTAGVGAGTMHVKKDDRVSLAGTDLVVANITEEDAGPYTCELDSEEETTLSVTHTLQILVAPRLHKHPSSGSLVVKKGSTVNLKCQASGFPLPKISWSRLQGSLSNGAKYQEGSEYSIHNISRHQSGVYRCQAGNGVGLPVFQDITLNVLYSPEAVAELTTVHTGLGAQASLSCIVNANPTATVRWYRSSLMLASDNHYLMESRGSRHTFIIRSVRVENFGNFTCSATNTFGKMSAEILVTGKPKTPVFQSNILSQRSHAHSLTWRTESHSPILEYRLMYRKIPEDSGGSVLYVWTTLSLRGEEGQGSAYNYTYVLDNLEQDSKYEVKVEAQNDRGWSGQAQLFRFFTRNIDDSPKQLPVEPEKTPAPSRTLDHRFSSSSLPSSPSSLLVLFLLLFLC